MRMIEDLFYGNICPCEKSLTRGSVVYLNQKMINAFADELRKRDESDGICRLRN